TLSVLVVSALGQQTGEGGLGAPGGSVSRSGGPGQSVALPSGGSYTIYPADPNLAPGGLLPQPAGASPWTSQHATHRSAAMSADERNLANSVEFLVRSLGDAKTEDLKDAIKGKLSKALEGQFDLRQKRHEAEIAEL